MRRSAKKGGSTFLGGCGLNRNYVMEVVSLSFLCNYDNLTLKLDHEKRSYPDERWLFTARFKVGSVPGKSVGKSPRKFLNFTIQLFILKKDSITPILLTNC